MDSSGPIPEVAGLPERVLVVRDQDLLHPDAPPAKSEPATPQILLDPDGDTINTHTGYGKPAKDLSVNFVPVPYPGLPTGAREAAARRARAVAGCRECLGAHLPAPRAPLQGRRTATRRGGDRRRAGERERAGRAPRRLR